MTDWTPYLPGIELPQLGSSGIERAAQATLDDLAAAELLKPADTLTVQLVLELAAAVGRGLTAGRVTVATTTLVGQLTELLDRLPARPEGLPEDDPMTALAAQLRADLANAQGQG